MSIWVRIGSDSYYEELPFHIGGDFDALHYEMNETEKRAFKKELKEKLARKRPIGFAPWPDEGEE